jgi:MraZ protein
LGSGSVFDEAAFVGQGRRFQIWEPNRFAAHFEEAKARVRRLRAEIGFPVAQGAWE